MTEKDSIDQIIKKSKSLNEYIVNTYIYCLENNSEILDSLNNQIIDYQNKSNKLVLELKPFNNYLDYFKYNKAENIQNLIIQLLAIDALLSELHNQKSIISNTIPINCIIDNKKYILTNKPKNMIYDFLEQNKKSYKKPKEFSNELKNYFSNFLIIPIKVSSINCYIKDLKDIDSSTENMITKPQDITLGIFSNHNIPNLNIITLENTNSDKPLIYIDKIHNSNDINNEIEKILEEAYKENISIVILPELFIYDSSRKIIKDWLRTNNEPEKILMVIAGSMHIYNAINNECINESIIYNSLGESIHSQKKLSTLQKKDFKEYINYQDKKFICIDSKIGRFSLSICLDFITDPFKEMNKQFSVNLHFVPALSDRLEDFETNSQINARNNSATTLCANTITKSDLQDRGFMYFPMNSDNNLKKIISSINNLYYLKIKLDDLINT